MEQLIDPSLASQFEKMPPHSMDAEMSLLASLMLCDGDFGIFSQTRSLVHRDSFYSADHQIVFDVLCQLQDDHQKIDVLTVREALIRRQLYEEIGGREMLATIMNLVPSPAHFDHYARIVREKHILRQVIQLGNNLIRKGYGPTYDVTEADQILANAATTIAKLSTDSGTERVYPLADVLAEVSQRKETGEAVRIPTGIASLDVMIGGLRRGGKVIVGGKPGMGKSALLKQLAKLLAAAGTAVGIISIEESRHKIAENLIANESGVPNCRIAFQTATERDWVDIELAVERMNGLPLYICDSVRSVSSIKAIASLMVGRFKCEAIIVDHLHIIDAEAQHGANRERQISVISAELKWLWKDLDVCGVEAAQLNRASGNERPSLSSLRDSGSLEQDADVVILLHREDYYRRKDEGYVPDQILEAIIDKNKDGATGTVKLIYDEARNRFKDLPHDPLNEPNW